MDEFDLSVEQPTQSWSYNEEYFTIKQVFWADTGHGLRLGTELYEIESPEPSALRLPFL